MKRKGKGKKTPRRGKPRRIVSDAVVEEVRKEFLRWLWARYRAGEGSMEWQAGKIGMSRVGLGKVFVNRREVLFGTFVRGLFLGPVGESGITIAAEGWRVELRWTIGRCNSGYISNGAEPP